MWKFQGSIKKEVEFLRVYKKKHCNFHDWVLVLDLKTSKGCHKILQSFQG